MRNINAQKGIAPIILLMIMGLIAVGGVGAGYGYVKMKKAKEAKVPEQKEQAKKSEAVKENGMPEKVSVKMNVQNDSGISGVAVLSLSEGKVKVNLDLKDPIEGVTRPAHIHLGKCPGHDSIFVGLQKPDRVRIIFFADKFEVGFVKIYKDIAANTF